MEDSNFIRENYKLPKLIWEKNLLKIVKDLKIIISKQFPASL